MVNIKSYEVDKDTVDKMAEEVMVPIDVNNSGFSSSQVLVTYNNHILPMCITRVWLQDNELEKNKRVILTCGDNPIKVFVHNSPELDGIVYTISHD